MLGYFCSSLSASDEIVKKNIDNIKGNQRDYDTLLERLSDRQWIINYINIWNTYLHQSNVLLLR